MKKYEITETSLFTCSNIEIFKIKALKDFADVKKGQLGGYVEKESNLSQEGDCWIYSHASACDNSRVQDDAKLKDFCRLTDYAKLSVNAVMKDEAILEGYGFLSGNAVMMNDTFMTGRSSASGDAILTKNPVYIHAGKVHVTMTDKHITLDGVSHRNQYTKQEWLDMQNEVIDKKHGIEWREKWKPIFKAIIES